MELELKYIIPYIEYNLQVLDLSTCGQEYECYMTVEDVDKEMNQIIAERVGWDLDKIKPILRPLSESDLLKPIDENGKRYWGSNEFTISEWDSWKDGNRLTDVLSYNCIIELIKRHFDVFGLIPRELAIDVNSIN